MAVRFVAVGELLVDVLAEGAGHDARIRLRPAGSAFNAAVVLSMPEMRLIIFAG